DPGPMRTPEAQAAADSAATVLVSYLDDLIARRRANPGDDLLSLLIAAEEAGDRLSHDELVAMSLLLVIAGHEPTANLSGNGLVALPRHPAELARRRDDPGLDRPAVEELLRYDGPIQKVERITLEEFELAGVCIPKGNIVIPVLGAANRDPAAFDSPDRLHLCRSEPNHAAFGGGIHFCVGAALARVEAGVAVPMVLRRLPGLRLVTTRPRWRASFTIRGLSELPVCWNR